MTKRMLSGHYGGQTFNKISEAMYRFILLGKNDENSEWVDLSWHLSLTNAQIAMKYKNTYNILRIIPVTSNEHI